MKTKTSKALALTGQIDVFLGFQMRIQSLEFLKGEIDRQRERGEKLMADLADMPRTGDVLRDGRREAELEEQLEEAFETYGNALSRLGWELSH